MMNGGDESRKVAAEKAAISKKKKAGPPKGGLYSMKDAWKDGPLDSASREQQLADSDEVVTDREEDEESPNVKHSARGAEMIIQFQVVKELKRKRKRKVIIINASDSEGDDRGNKGLEGISRIRRRIGKKPRHIVKEFEVKMKDRLHTSGEGDRWSYANYSQALKTKLGRLKGYWRVHWYLASFLDILRKGRVDQAQATLIALRKGLPQFSLDGGEWTTARFMLPFDDPVGADEWAGGEKEISDVVSYTRSIRDLKQKMTAGLDDKTKEEDAKAGQ